MSFNNGKETKVFETNWKKIRKEYESLGMTPEVIQELYDFDKANFLSTRRYIEHTQTLTMEFSDYGPQEVPNSLVEKYEGFTVEFSQTHLSGLTGWINDVEDQVLLEKLKKLSQLDLEILSLHTQVELSQAEIAKIYTKTQSTICERLLKIKNFLK